MQDYSLVWTLFVNCLLTARLNYGHLHDFPITITNRQCGKRMSARSKKCNRNGIIDEACQTAHRKSICCIKSTSHTDIVLIKNEAPNTLSLSYCSRDGISVTPILGVLVAIGCGLALVAVAIIFVLRFKMSQIITMNINYLLESLLNPFLQVQALQLFRSRRFRQRRLLRQKQRRQRLQGKQILIDLLGF